MSAPKPFGWQGPKPPHAGRDLPQRQHASLGNNDPGRVNDFMKGYKESHDTKVKIALEMLGAAVGVKAWSAWCRTKP
jgi:hypothetical protein